MNTVEKSRQYIVIRVKNRNLQCLVDSGSCNSITSDKLAYNLGLNIESSMSTSPLIAASGQQLNIVGKTSITLYINGLMIVLSFAVVKDLFPSLLVGDDFLRKNSAMINYSNNTVTLYDGLIVLPLQGFNDMNNCACIYRTVCVPSFSEILIPVRLPKQYKGTEAILEPLPNNPTQAFVGGCVTAVKNAIGMIRMLNFRPHPITLKRNALAASVIFPSSVSSITPFENSSEQQAKIPILKSHV